MCKCFISFNIETSSKSAASSSSVSFFRLTHLTAYVLSLLDRWYPIRTVEKAPVPNWSNKPTKFYEMGLNERMNKSADKRRVKEEENRKWDETLMQKFVFVTLNWVRHTFKHSRLIWKQSTQSGMTISCNTKEFGRLWILFNSRTMPYHLTLTTPFNRYNSSKRLPLLELGTGVSSTFNELSTVFIFSVSFTLGSTWRIGLQWNGERAAPVAVVELWPENDVYRSLVMWYVEDSLRTFTLLDKLFPSLKIGELNDPQCTKEGRKCHVQMVRISFCLVSFPRIRL